MSEWLIGALILLSLLMSAQAIYAVFLMLYTWNSASTYEATRAPRNFRQPELSFTVLIPAQHEELVIGRTLQRIMMANYPHELLEVLVVCEAHDISTIDAALAQIKRMQRYATCEARVVTFSDQPVSKPHGLNKGLAEATHDVVVVFDAEDEVHPDIFSIANTVMLDEGVHVVQAGVQVMNHQSSWFALHQVLEYYFWFKSRLHVHARSGMTPLGGNSIFLETGLLRRLDGWDESNLTEDADIGIRLSVLGERVRVVYDDEYVTKEEAAPDLASFIRQRTRWNQGFIQTLRKGLWRRVRYRHRALAFYILSFPLTEAIQAVYVPVAAGMILWAKLPMVVTLILLLPGYCLIGHCLMSAVGIVQFSRAHNMELKRGSQVTLLVTYFPYLLILGFATLRAVWREIQGHTNWEKTAHVGAHRIGIVDLDPADSLLSGVTRHGLAEVAGSPEQVIES